MLRDRVVLIFSILFFLCASFFLYFFAPDILVHLEKDSIGYDFIARHFCYSREIPLEVLGYPFFLRIIYVFFGHSFGIVVFVQVLLSIIALFVFRKIVRSLMGRSAQRFITLLWAANLGFFIFSQLILIEIVLTLLYICFIERSISFYENPSRVVIAEAAFFLSLSILFRPAALFYAFCFAPFLLFIWKRSLLYRFSAGLVFIIVFYIPIILYMFLNLFMFGRFVLCPVMNVNLFSFFYPKFLGVLQEYGIAPNTLIAGIDADIAVDAVSSKTQMNLIKLAFIYPFIFAKIWATNMLKSYVGLYQTEWKQFFGLDGQTISFFSFSGSFLTNVKRYIEMGTDKHWLYALGWYEFLYLIIEYLFAFFGALWLLFRKKIWLFFFAGSFIFYFGLITGPDGSGRFRMMIESWLIVLAALGLACLFGLKDEKPRRMFNFKN